MPIETKDILSFLFGDDATGIDSMDKVKEKFTGETAIFVPSTELNDPKSETFRRFMPKAVGTIAGKSTSVLKRKLSELGIELSSEEIKDKPLEEVLEIGLSKTVNNVKSKYTEFEGKLVQNTDDRVNSLTQELNTVKQKYQDTEGLLSGLKTTYEQEVTNHKNQLKGLKLQTIVDKYHSGSVKFGQAVKDLEKDGYWRRIENKYMLDLNDTGEDVEVFDRTTKSRIPNPKQAGAFLTYKDVLESEGMEAGIWSTNDSARKMNQMGASFAPSTPANDTPPTNNGLRKASSRFSG